MIHRRNLRQIVAGLLLAMPFVFLSAQAHEVRPAYLEIKETVPGQFSLLWRTPVLAGMRLPFPLLIGCSVVLGLLRGALNGNELSGQSSGGLHVLGVCIALFVVLSLLAGQVVSIR